MTNNSSSSQVHPDSALQSKSIVQSDPLKISALSAQLENLARLCMVGAHRDVLRAEARKSIKLLSNI